MKTKNIVLFTAGVTAGCAAAFAGVSYAITSQMVRFALDRKQPALLEKKAKMGLTAKADSPVRAVSKAAMEKLEAAPHEVVEMQSYDGLRLVGHWFPCPGAKRVIVAMHGWRSRWCKDFALISEFWQQQGCSVLYAEQRGQGDSEGEYMGFGMLERYDCRAWIDWVNEKTGSALPVYLAGISMGASTVLMTAGFDLPENVRGVLADCGFTSVHDIWRHVLKNGMHLGYNGLQGAIANDLCRRKISVGTKEYSTLDALKQAKVPILFVHGTADKFVPIRMTYENYAACAGEKRLLVVPGAEHGTSFFVDRPAYEKALLDFWKEYDR